MSLRSKIALASVPLALAACGGGSTTAADRQAPTVSSTWVTISSDVATLHATATDDVKVTSVQFRIDDKVVLAGVQDAGGGWHQEMDARQVTAGPHTVRAVALDAAGNSSLATTTLTVTASPADTVAPTVSSANVTISSGVAYFTATATDDVKVDAVQFLMDGNVVLGNTQQNNDGSWLHEIDAAEIPAGTHTVTAVALDAAGNSGQATTSVTVAAPGLPVPDTVAPVVTAGVDGNFGLVKLTAVATDDVRLSAVQFFVDGQATDSWAGQSYMGSDPAHESFTVFDTTSLANGPHTVVARATDTSGNQTDSAEAVLTVDNTAGLVEREPNDTMASATVVPAGQTQVSGTLAPVVTGQYTTPDTDFYKVSVPAGKTLVADVLASQFAGFFAQVVDADGTVLSAPLQMTASAVRTVSYSNGAATRDVFIQVNGFDLDFKDRGRYRLSLSYR